MSMMARLISRPSAIVIVALVAFGSGFLLRGCGSEEAAHPEHVEAAAEFYTCSMHPSVRLTDPEAKCPICFMDLIPVGGSADLPAGQIELSEQAAAASRIETAAVERYFPQAELRLFGKLTFDETSVVRLSAYFPGRLERLFVNYNSVPVKKGDHLAELYSPEALTAIQELRQARLSHDNSAQMSELVRRSTANLLDSSREKLRLFGLTSSQITKAEVGEFDGDRITVFSPIGGVVTELSAREGDYVKTGDRIATIADLSHLWLDLEAYESQLPLLRWGQAVTFTVQSHPGEVFEGRIAFIDPVVDNDTRTAAVRIAVDNDDGRLKPGMFATSTIRARVGNKGAVLSDELAGRWVSPMHPTIVKDSAGSCDVCGMDLVPAESLGVVGDPSSAREPLVVPRTAVLFTGKRSIVYVQVKGAASPTYEGREIELGPRAGDHYVVARGLSEGEQVVVHGAFRVDSAMQILAKPSMMSSSRGATSDGMPSDFIRQLDPVYESYLSAQEMLAADDLEGFEAARVDLVAKVSEVDVSDLRGQALSEWNRRTAAFANSHAIDDINAARAGFETLSKAIIDLERQFGHAGTESWSIAHCPMAFDNQGADWMQRGEVINNPYFGSSMLRCGSIEKKLEPTHE